MRPIQRPPLGRSALTALRALTNKVNSAVDPKRAAARLWSSKPRAAFLIIKSTLQKMAASRSRCMYCEDSFGTDIEHFYPKTKYPSRAFSWVNYLLACSHCNSNDKRDAFPMHWRKPSLLDPTSDDPTLHLVFLPTTGEFKPIGPKGQPSIDVFALNDTAAPRKLPQARKAVFHKLQLLIEDYEHHVTNNDAVKAEFVKEIIQDEPFPAVLHWLIAIAKQPAAAVLLRPGIPSLLTKHAIATWST